MKEKVFFTPNFAGMSTIWRVVLQSEDDKLVVAFYDLSKSKSEADKGIFIQKYYAETLFGKNFKNPYVKGLALYGSHPYWTISQEYMQEIRDWVVREVYA